MLRIGEFAVLSGISIPMLRNYDKIRLLVPAHIDKESGYRFYDKDQLVEANQIVAMKSMGFGLEEIKNTFSLDKEGREALFRSKLKEKQQELKAIKHQLSTLENFLSIHEEMEETIALRVVKKSTAFAYAIGLRRVIQEYHEEGLMWEELRNEISLWQIKIAQDCPAISMWFERESDSSPIIAQIALLSPNKLTVKSPLTCEEFPACEVASVLFQGSYRQISKINILVAKWLEMNHYEIAGMPFSIYHKSPRENKDEKTFLTELCFPIKKMS